MFTRVVSVQAQLDKLDEGIAICRSLEPLWQQQRGFRHADLLVDRSTGKIMTISLWETRADLEATEASGWYQEQVAKFARIWVSPPVREIFEVPVHVEAARAVGGA
jgi:heme-degrading monooxygenase HmoA